MDRPRTSRFFADSFWPHRAYQPESAAISIRSVDTSSRSARLDDGCSLIPMPQDTLSGSDRSMRHNTFGLPEDTLFDRRRHTEKEGSGYPGSFSGLRSLRRRASSVRQKSFLKSIFQKPTEEVLVQQEVESSNTERHGVLSRLRRAASMSQGRNRRPSTSTSSALHSREPRAFNPVLEVPQVDIDVPKNSHIPTGGAAARAAAAAQNEMYGSTRSLALHDSLRIWEPKITNDCESGIGIDLRDRSDELVNLELPLARMDPSRVLPEELLAHVMSFLDATSLMRSELVSRRWYGTASSDHAWKHVFHKEHGLPCLSLHDESLTSVIGDSGLGKRRPDQNWKRMWKVRRTLNRRWLKGHAAAIYLEGHKDSVYCVQFDEHKILTGSRDRTVRVWDTHTYECLKVLGVPKINSQPQPQEPLTDLAYHGSKPSACVIPPRPAIEPQPSPTPPFHHDGSILCLQFDQNIMVTGSSDHTCIVWSIQDEYRPIQQLRHHTAGVLDVCFDDKHIVSCSKDTSICLWDRQTGEFLRVLTGHRGPVNAVQLRANLIVSASGDGIAKLWNLASGLCIKEFPSRDRGMACVEFSPDSRTILAGGNDQVIYQFDANSGELIRELKGHRGLVRSLHLDSANGRVISGSYDTSVKAYDVNTGDMICDFAGWTTSWMLSAKADYRRIVATSQDSRAIIIDFGYQLPGIELLEA